MYMELEYIKTGREHKKKHKKIYYYVEEENVSFLELN